MVEVILHGGYTGPEGTYAAGATVELPEQTAADLVARKFARLPGEPAPDLAEEDHSLPPEPEPKPEGEQADKPKKSRRR